jgi:hypothetical protein
MVGEYVSSVLSIALSSTGQPRLRRYYSLLS